MFFRSSDLNKHVHESHGKLLNCNISGNDFVTKVKCLKQEQMAHPAKLEVQGIPTSKRYKEYPIDGDKPLIHIFSTFTRTNYIFIQKKTQQSPCVMFVILTCIAEMVYKYIQR